MSTKVRLMIPAWLGLIGYAVDGWAGVLSFVVLFFIVVALWYSVFEPILRDLSGFFNRPVEHHHYIHQERQQQGPPDIEGTATRHPDPTRPHDYEDEWAGAITVRLKGGQHK